MIQTTRAAGHPAGRADARLLLTLSLCLLVARIAYLLWVTPYGLAPDEAQYWTWLRHNDWSFLTKPPLTTWLMGLSTAVLGQTLVGVKIFALINQVLVAVLGFAIAARVAGRAAGWWSWMLLTTSPIIAAGGLLMVPDAIMLPLYLAALLMVVRATQAESVKEALRWPRWISIGVLVGLAGLGKYSAVFFYPSLGLFMLVWRREWFKHPAVWVSGLIALALQAPVISWNLHHHLDGLHHVLWQADFVEDESQGGLKTLNKFIGSQILVLGPLAFLMLIAAWGGWLARIRRISPQQGLLLVFSLPIVLGFAALTMHCKVQANWPLLGTVVGMVLLGVWLAQTTPPRRWLMWLGVAALALNTLLSTMLMDTYAFRQIGMLPLKPKNDPTKDLRGWPQMGPLLGVVLQHVKDPVILSSRYQTLAPLMFHTPGHFQVAYLNAEGRRATQYDLWPKPNLQDRVVVYVNEQADNLPQGVSDTFGTCTPWHKLAVQTDGITTRKLGLWLCINPKADVWQWGAQHPSGTQDDESAEPWWEFWE